MPQRFLRPGITNSCRWNSVSERSQNFYVRLLTLVDDYGRFDGRPSVLHGGCFSVWNELNTTRKVNLQQVEQMLQQLADKELIEWYEVDTKKVVQISQWQERIRENTKSKWPERTEVAASCSKLLRPTPSPSPSPVHQRQRTNGSHEPPVPTADDLIVELGKDETYRGIDVRREYGKMAAWCKARKGAQPTRRRFVNWLNRVERPLEPVKINKSRVDPSKVDIPNQFRLWAIENDESRRDEIAGWKTWADVPDQMRRDWWGEAQSKLLEKIGAG